MNEFTLIGVDGGATKVSAWTIMYNNRTEKFSLGTRHSEKQYSDIPGWLAGFSPVDIKTQLAHKAEENIKLSADELQQATVYIEAAARAIEEIAARTESKTVCIGLGMPGLKTADKRGIEVLANGPRMVDYCNMLEQRLNAAGVKLVAPVYQLGSDADYCGMGENYAAEGAFVSCTNAYYLGGGTGVADALKLRGQLVPLDTTKEWMAKTWELKSADGQSLERSCSSSGIQSIYARIAEISPGELNAKAIYPAQIAEKAHKGDTAAIETFDYITNQLAKLIVSRITTLACGWQNDFEFINSSRPELIQNHPFLGLLFEKIILGQRLGALYNLAQARDIFKRPLLEKCESLIKNDKTLGSALKKQYQPLQKIITISKLREAPALGAGVDALRNYKKHQLR